MHFEKANEKLFDGDERKAYEAEMSCSSDGLSIQFKLQDLIEFSILAKNIYINELSYIQAELGFDVIDFDGEKIFQGRKKGLSLFGLLRNEEADEILLFSCGEFQPGRFQVFFEGRLRR